jgi:hypothetical protein
MPWGWDPTAKRYRDLDTGRFMLRSEVLAWVEESLDASTVATDQLAQFVIDGVVSPADFGLLMRQELKEEYIRQYLLGIGGRAQMTPADWGSIGGMLADQYRYLDRFVVEISSGTIPPGSLLLRVRMYANSAREAYERAHLKNANALGMVEENWVLGDAEHCSDCVAFAGMGWQPIGTFPFPGEGATECLTNCKCHKIYRDPASGRMY